MIFDFFKRRKKYSKKEILKIGNGFYDIINPHLSNFQKIIKSNLDSNPKLSKYYNIDYCPNLDISEKDLTVGCSLTFADKWDECDDICNSKIIDQSIINKIFEMESKIMEDLRSYCNKNNLNVKFINNRCNWDDAGISCVIDIGFIFNKTESGVFSNIDFI